MAFHYIYYLMTIAFIHNQRAFLPEIEAYISFFSTCPGITTAIWDQTATPGIQADVEWYFMGMHRKRKKNNVVIHEYASASLPPFATAKNALKTYFNCVPDYRIFYSPYVQQQFGFTPGVPAGLRAHGVKINDPVLKKRHEKHFDFVYAGTLDEKRNIENLFQCFTTGNLKHKTLLILSRDYAQIADRLSPYGNICFKGPVPYNEVYSWVVQARYGINFIPDKTPFNKQVAAKLLDYAACGIPVISSDYEWVRTFQQQYGGSFFFLDNDLNNFTWENIGRFNYAAPNLQEWTWENQIEKSGVLSFLQKKFPEISFP